jgi:hypothetical protein
VRDHTNTRSLGHCRPGQPLVARDVADADPIFADHSQTVPVEGSGHALVFHYPTLTALR